MKTIAFMSAQGSVGKTNLVYHLAHMLSRMGYPTLAVDLDPQATLSSMFFDDRQLRASWEGMGVGTVFSAIAPAIMRGGQVHPPDPQLIEEQLWFLAGAPAMWSLESPFAEAWMKGRSRDQSALNFTSAVDQLLKQAGQSTQCTVALMDMGAGLSALNRAAVIASDFLVFPLTVDAFATPGIQVLGPTLFQWNEERRQLRALNRDISAGVPDGQMTPAGYTVLRLDAFRGARFSSRATAPDEIPFSYSQNVLGQASFSSVDEDPNCLSILRNYASLMSMAQDARVPMFDLTPSMGALGSYSQLVRHCHDDFERLASRLVDRCHLDKPSSP